MNESDKIQKQINALIEKLNSPTVPEDAKKRIKKLIQDLILEANSIIGGK